MPEEGHSKIHHKRRKRYIIAIIVGLLLIFGGSSSYFLIVQPFKPIPYSVRRQLNMPLYYPSQLPVGYTVDPQSFTVKDGVLIFSIKGPKRNIAVSEQTIPLDLNVNAPNPSGIKTPDETNISTPIGKAQISLWGDKYVSSLLTEKTWIILNVTGYTADEATVITHSFSPL